MRRKMGNVQLGIVTVILLLSGAACGTPEGEKNEPDALTQEERESESDGLSSEEASLEEEEQMPLENEEQTGAACGMPEGEKNEPDALTQEERESESDGLSSEEASLEEEEQLPLETDEQIEEGAASLDHGTISLGERIYDMKKPIEGAADFCGEWIRTQIHTGSDGSLVITEQTSERFSFEMECVYFYHSGYLSGEAWLVTPHLAIARIDHEYCDGEHYVAFVRSDESVMVYATGGDSELGLGGYVRVTGEYGKGEPVYTNAGQFDAYFSGDADVFMREKLSEEEYEWYFRYPAEWGYVKEISIVLADGIKARLLQVTVPTDGAASFDMIITEDGRIYADFNNYEFSTGFVTNDDSAESMPGWETAE